MKRWVVLEPRERPRSEVAAEPSLSGKSAAAVFVRDGFSIFALLLPVLWLWRYGLVLSGLLAAAILAALALLAGTDGLGPAVALLPLLVGLLTALEGPSLRVARYLRRGYHEAAIVHARDIADAEILYYAGKAREPVPVGETNPATRPFAQRSRASTSLLDPIGTR